MTLIMNLQADEQLDRLMTRMLESAGFRMVDLRAGGAQPARPDVIIVNTDISVAEKRVCIAALRALAHAAAIVDISRGAGAPGYDSGADAYLAKPFTAEGLIDTVRQVSSPSAAGA